MFPRLSWIEKRAPAALRGEFDDPARWPFVIGQRSERFQLSSIGCDRAGEPLALPVGEEVRPVLRIDIGRANENSVLARSIIRVGERGWGYLRGMGRKKGKGRGGGVSDAL